MNDYRNAFLCGCPPHPQVPVFSDASRSVQELLVHGVDSPTWILTLKAALLQEMNLFIEANGGLDQDLSPRMGLRSVMWKYKADFRRAGMVGTYAALQADDCWIFCDRLQS